MSAQSAVIEAEDAFYQIGDIRRQLNVALVPPIGLSRGCVIAKLDAKNPRR
jgi:hypothetical protein